MDCACLLAFFLDKWSLQAVRWWGGWAKNDSIETIMKCLLEEIEGLECNFSDMFSPNRSGSIRSTFMGEDSTITPTQLAHELKKQKDTLIEEFS